MSSSEVESHQRRTSVTSFRRRSSKDLWSGLSRRLSHGSLKDLSGWQCDHCTYKNKEAEYLSCEMCGMIRAMPSNTESLDYWQVSDRSIQVGDSSIEVGHRLTQESADQEYHIRKASQDRQDQYQLALIQERMQEIVERQRLLYDEILEKRVRRDSIPFHLETQKSIDNLQELLKSEHKEEEPPTITPASNAPEQKEQAVQRTANSYDASFLIPSTLRTRSSSTATTTSSSATEATDTTPLPAEPPSPKPTKRHDKNTELRVNRRVTRRARNCQNPVQSMMANPWEERTLGVQDILNVQEELWERVSGGERHGKLQKQGAFRLIKGRGKKRHGVLD